VATTVMVSPNIHFFLFPFCFFIFFILELVSPEYFYTDSTL
jgi:hypothetical protein